MSRYQDYYDHIKALTGCNNPLTIEAMQSLKSVVENVETIEGITQPHTTVTPFTYVHCPDCDQLYHVQKWHEGVAHCDDCGDHPAVVCPAGHTFDTVHNHLEVITPETPLLVEDNLV